MESFRSVGTEKSSVPFPSLQRIIVMMMMRALIKTIQYSCMLTKTLRGWMSCVFTVYNYCYIQRRQCDTVTLTAQACLHSSTMLHKILHKYHFYHKDYGAKKKTQMYSDNLLLDLG